MTDTTTLEAAMRAIEQALSLIGEPQDERMRTVRRVLRGAVVIAEDAAAQPQPQPAQPLTGAGGRDTLVLVPLKFVQGFNDLAHNYQLQAVPPDYYHGVEGDAFRSAYKRCGADLKRLRDILTAPSTPTPEVAP